MAEWLNAPALNTGSPSGLVSSNLTSSAERGVDLGYSYSEGEDWVRIPAALERGLKLNG